MSLELTSTLLCEMDVVVETSNLVGPTPRGMRMIGNITGGTVSGPKLNGKVLPSGADWLIIRGDGVLDVDVRAAIETDDGAVIYTHYLGRWVNPAEIAEQMADVATASEVDPSKYYLRTTPYFEAGAEQYAWLNSIVSVGVGRRTKTGVRYKIYQIT